MLAPQCASPEGGLNTYVDKALLAVDEALFRKSLRADLLADPQAERLRLREELRLQLEQAAADYRLQAGRRIELVFVPARDG